MTFRNTVKFGEKYNFAVDIFSVFWKIKMIVKIPSPTKYVIYAATLSQIDLIFSVLKDITLAANSGSTRKHRNIFI